MNSLSKFILIPLLPLLLQCSDADDKLRQNCNDAFCTEEFVSLSVSIFDNDDNPVPLDSYTVFSFEKDKFITPRYTQDQLDLMVAYNAYTIFSDLFVREYQNRTTRIRFAGQINGNEVVASDFTVGADCCHVSLISGNAKIVAHLKSSAMKS